VVRVSEVEQPAAGDNQLLVKVHAATVNRMNCHYWAGTPWIMRPMASGLTRPRMRVLGNEFAGQVVHLPGCSVPRSSPRAGQDRCGQALISR
jgi:NADPH:quinone reductase-like Zn-dependent oxidoreductase